MRSGPRISTCLSRSILGISLLCRECQSHPSVPDLRHGVESTCPSVNLPPSGHSFGVRSSGVNPYAPSESSQSSIPGLSAFVWYRALDASSHMQLCCHTSHCNASRSLLLRPEGTLPHSSSYVFTLDCSSDTLARSLGRQ